MAKWNMPPTDKRPMSDGLNAILGTPIPVLDHGFVIPLDYMGNDQAVADAARNSYGKGTTQVNDDRHLLRYLMRHSHTSPFEMCDIRFQLKMPIFVARQWVRHRTASINEVSARYSVLDREFYIPSPNDIAIQSAVNKQGRGERVAEAQALQYAADFADISQNCYNAYEWLLDEDIARETARMVLPTNIYTQMTWKVDLHNLLHFLRLRADPHAQMEIRVYAEVILDIVKAWVPIIHEAFVDYQLEAVTFSRMEMEALLTLIEGRGLWMENMSDREKKDFRFKIGLDA